MEVFQILKHLQKRLDQTLQYIIYQFSNKTMK